MLPRATVESEIVKLHDKESQRRTRNTKLSAPSSYVALMCKIGFTDPFADAVGPAFYGWLAVRGRRSTVVCRTFASPYVSDMQAKLSVSSRGLVALPSAMLEAAGIRAHDIVIAETTPEGILLRPAVTLPVESYSGERIAEFDAAESEMADATPVPSDGSNAQQTSSCLATPSRPRVRDRMRLTQKPGTALPSAETSVPACRRTDRGSMHFISQNKLRSFGY